MTDYISEGGHFYLVMEYMQGKGLNQLIKERQLGEEELLSIAKDVLQSLHHAHSKGIIHRDIKPSNIMIADDHRANLMDFGIAFLVSDKTKQIDVAGSPLYMSPEQLNRPETMDHRTDIYSMGIVMFEMFTGRKPYDGKPDDGTRFDMDVGEVLTATSDCAPELAEIVAKCMEWRPEDRFKDCQEIISRIEAYERQTHLECRKCKTINRVRDKYHLKGEKCVSCGRTLSMKSRFTKIWATAFALAAALILAYLFVPWPGTLVVTTTPEAAEVFIGGEPSGLSPFEISLSPGAYDVVIKMEGFEDFARTVTIQKHKKSDLNVDLPRTDEMPRIAYDAIRKAYQTAAYICRDLNDMAASEANLGIAESIGDSALTTAYRNQIAELVQNIDDGFAKYVETFRELKAIRPAIRDAAYQKYVQTLQHKGGSLDNLAVVWRHFNEFAGQAVSIEAWKEGHSKILLTLLSPSSLYRMSREEKMNRPIAAILIACLLLFTACSGMSQEKKAAGEGATIGAAVGALIGQVFGKDTESTVTGAVIGAAIGGAIGYGLAAHLNREKAKLEGRENDLDARIEYAQAVNDETSHYNQKLIADLEKIEDEVAAGRLKKAQLAQINEKVMNDKARLDSELAELQAFRRSFSAENTSTSKVSELDLQIRTLEEQLAGLETNIEKLAGISQRVKV